MSERDVYTIDGGTAASRGERKGYVRVACMCVLITINTAKKASKDTLTKSFPPYFSLYFK